MASSGVRPIYQTNYNENAYTNFSHPVVYPQCNALNSYSNSVQPYSTQYPNTGILVKPSTLYGHDNQKQLQPPNYAESTAIPFSTKS